MDNITIPKLLQRIMQWENDIAQHVPKLERPSGYFLKFDPLDNGGYYCSPFDAIVFANTGMDGIHYSFLTDFGMHTDLEQAPILCVSPMDFGNCVRIVARNLQEFFELHFEGHEDLLLNDFKTEEDYMNHRREQENNSSEYIDKDTRNQQKQWVRERAAEQFGFRPIENAFQTVQAARASRQRQVIIPTLDGLGIISDPGNSPSEPCAPHPWHKKDITYDELEAVGQFVRKADAPGLFSLIRDAQHQDLLHPEYVKLLGSELTTRGYLAEASRLRRCMTP